MPTKNTRAPISKVQRLKDQGANGSPAYEFATKIARAKDKLAIGTVTVGNTSRPVSQWCNPSKAPPPNFITQRRSARLSVSKGAGDAMISHPHLSEARDGTPMRYFIGDAGCNPT